MRRVKIGDIVQAFWDANTIGEVVDLGAEKTTTWMVNGTLDVLPYCIIKKNDGTTIRMKLSDVFHVD